MGVFAKVLAVIVLIGAVLGIVSTAASVIPMASYGAFDADAEARAIVVGQLALGVFFSLCGAVLAIMVLAAPGRRA